MSRPRLLLTLVFLLALFLRLFRIGLDGFSNLYYAATVQSMLTSWYNFFYAAFDPAGFVSVDKPPLGFWIQALSVKIFGFHGWTLVLPQALAGVLSTLVLYYLVKRVFGSNAGLLAALILAITPISVATDRSNTPDGQLVFILLLAALAAVKAAESGKLRWLLVSAALVGIGFNVKMLEAYVVVPAFFFFLPPPHSLLKRLGQLTLAMLVMFTISFAWPLAVDLTPASARPYVGSTVTNHVIELVAVHNGARRLGPIAAWFGIREKEAPPAIAAEIDATQLTPQPVPAQPPNPTPVTDTPQSGPDGGSVEVGGTGPLRLFNPQMAGQVSWLLPVALLAMISGMARLSWKLPLGREILFYLLWAGWLIPTAFLYSYGGLIHRYYLNMLAPPIAALSAVGIITWMDDFNARRRSAWLMPLAMVLTIFVTVIFLGYYPRYYFDSFLMLIVVPSAAGLAFWIFGFFKGQRAGWYLALAIAAATTVILFLLGFFPKVNPLILPALALGMLVILFFISRLHLRSEFVLIPILFSLLLVPFVWSTTPMWGGGDVVLPYANPELVYWGGERDNLTKYEAIAAFLQAQQLHETFITAADNAVVAAPLELLTRQPVMAMGGFTGADPILTDEQLADEIRNGNVRFFLVTHEHPITSERTQWLADHCQHSSLSITPKGLDLFDCRP